MLFGSDIVALDRESIPAMTRIEFSSQWRQRIKIYRQVKNVITSFEQTTTSWLEGVFDAYSVAINNLTTLLTTAISRGLVEHLFSDYLLTTGRNIHAIFLSLLPSLRSAWDIMLSLRPMVDQSALLHGGLSFESSCQHLLATGQKTGTTKFPDKIALGIEKIAIPSGRVHPQRNNNRQPGYHYIF